MLNVTVQITGDKEEIAKFRKLGDKLTDFSTALKLVGTELKNYYGTTVFKGEGSALGKHWQALSPVYKTWKGSHYPNKRILVASGTMQKSFRATSGKNSLVIDNTDPKFIYHQLGTGFKGASLVSIAVGKSLVGVGGVGPGRGRNLPARPMLAVNKDVEDIVGRIIKADVQTKLERTL